MAKAAKLKIQQWGNSLAVRIPSAVARSARLSAGQPVEVMVQDPGVVVVRQIGAAKLALEQKLALFDPAMHGGEVMAAAPVGAEAL
jgi:antitoxin MazE